jgi:hypothetical protein
MKPAFYQLLHNFILPQVQFVQPIIAQHYSAKQGYDTCMILHPPIHPSIHPSLTNERTNRAEDKYRYIYFNQMNLALKTSLKNRRLDLTRDILIIVTQMHTDFERAQENVTEVMIRTHNDIWVVGKRSDQREFYVVFDQESSNLLEVNGTFQPKHCAHTNWHSYRLSLLTCRGSQEAKFTLLQQYIHRLNEKSKIKNPQQMQLYITFLVWVVFFLFATANRWNTLGGIVIVSGIGYKHVHIFLSYFFKSIALCNRTRSSKFDRLRVGHGRAAESNSLPYPVLTGDGVRLSCTFSR